MKIAYLVILFLQVAGMLTQGIYVNVNLTGMEPLCSKTGGFDAVRDLRESLTGTRICIQPILTRYAIQAQRQGEIGAGLEHICSTYMDDATDCIKPLTKAIESCFRPDQSDTVDLVYRILPTAALKSMCDNIDDFQEALSSGDLGCVSIKKSAVTNCMAPFYPYVRHDESEDELASELGSVKITYDAEGCSKIQKFEQCSIRALAKCSDQSFSHLLETMYEYVNNELPCDNLPKSKASTTAGVVGVLLLMTAAIHVYL